MGINITGPKVLYTIPIFGGIKLTESVVHAWYVLRFVAVVCFILTRNLKVHNPSKRQVIAEKLVEMAYNLVKSNMGEQWLFFTPIAITLLVFSCFSSLASLTGIRSPTADFSVTLSMALVVFIIIEYYKFKTSGFIGYFVGLTKPLVVMTPMNILSEFTTPLSMSFRHYGNIASGVVISSLIYAALTAASQFVLGWIPNTFIANIPILQLGLPAVLSIYFDLFTSAMQAYIFCMLTMAFVKGATE